MSVLSLVVLSLLMAVPPASCQQGRGNLQPWMQGLIAVAVFLVLVAIAFAVNHFWCQEKPAPINMVMTIGNKADGILVGTDGKYSSMAASFRSSEHENAYENIPEEEGKGFPGGSDSKLSACNVGDPGLILAGYGTTDWFQIRKGVHQGCILSPCLFN
uniref:PDZK1-interacting protein 1 n=1 Tax=Bos taurus TaxID=9913 RepID=A0A452DII3_BOVIN